MIALAYFPPTPDELTAARALLRGEATPREQLHLACNVLCQSPDADDRMQAREVRNAMWSDVSSELLPEARALAERMTLGRNAELFAAINRRRQADRRFWILSAIAMAGLIFVAVL